MRFWVPSREAGNLFFVAVASGRLCGRDEQDVKRGAQNTFYTELLLLDRFE